MKQFKFFGVTIALFLGACGGGTGGTTGSEDPSTLNVYAGADQVAGINDSVRLQSMVEGAEPGVLEYQWQQTGGAPVIWPEGQDQAAPLVILPAAAGDITFELTVNSDNQSGSDAVVITAQGCNAEPGELYGDCLSAEFGPLLAYASSPNIAGIYFDGAADRHVQWQRIDSGDPAHGEVLEITWNANDENHQINGNGWLGMATRNGDALGAADLSAYAAGALQLDMRLIYHEQPNSASPFDLKMECIHPCVSGFFPLSSLERNYEWHTYSFSIAQMIASGLDITQVNHIPVIQPRWGAQEQTVTVQLDNVRLLPTYTLPVPGGECPGNGNVTYHLARAENPTDAQQNAYNLITQAMDVAVEKYNCYTDLARALYVEYNPGVATADGSTNGTIRFGATSSMHYVTAMHEISHVFGVGANNYRTLVSGGVYYGTRATQMLRTLTDDPLAEIHSDGTHLWPYGLNYISEGGSEQDLMFHCLIIEALAADLQNL